MRLTLCNEVVRELAFERQCSLAAGLGYQGLEVAPFTLGADAYRMPADARRQLRAVAADHGLAISGLHWLLVDPAGLSITSADEVVRARTLEVMQRLVELCHDLGGDYLVHGSPAQRRTAGLADAAARGRAAFAAIAASAEAAGVTYCIEPLAPPDADFVNTVAEAATIVRTIDQPAVRTMIDACAAAHAEAEPLAALIARWLPTNLVAHIHLNDRNRRGPGQGIDRFAPAIVALHAARYTGWIGIEPFEYVPDGATAAARAIGYVRALMEVAAA